MANGKIQIGTDVLETQEPLTTSQKAVVDANPYTDADKAKVATAIQSHQDISSKANKNLDNVSIQDFIAKLTAAGVGSGVFNIDGFKGVLATDPTGTHNDLDWYINDTDYTIRVWHGNAWHNVGGSSGTLSKAAILTQLGLTEAQLALIDESRLLNSTGDSHIKNSGGYHSETSFGGGAFLGWANASYSEMAGFKNLNGIANFRYRDRGGTMSDVPINTLKYGTLHTDSTANKAVIRKGTFWRSETDTSINTPYIGIFGDNNYQGKMYWDGANMALNWRDNTTTDKTIKLKDIAKNDLTGVNVGTANAGKIFQVKTDGTIEFLDTHTVTATLEDDSTLSFKVIQ